MRHPDALSGKTRYSTKPRRTGHPNRTSKSELAFYMCGLCTFARACVILGLAISSILLPKTARHHRHKLWDSTAPSRALPHTTPTTSGQLATRFPSSELTTTFRWQPFGPIRHWPDLGPRFIKGERTARTTASVVDEGGELTDKWDPDWSAVLKRAFEAFIHGETCMENVSLGDLGGDDGSSPRLLAPSGPFHTLLHHYDSHMLPSVISHRFVS